MASIPLREIGPLLRITVRYWYNDRAPRLGAALAYYMALSLAPSLVIVLAIAGFTDTYGAAGSLVVLLVWVYYSAQVFFFGAEFTRAYTNRFGSKSHLVLVP